MDRHSFVQTFTKESIVPAPPKAVFAWHEEQGAVEKLTPPWEKVSMIERAESLQVGSRVIFEVRTGPIKQRWVAEHIEYEPPRLFTDLQREGPFAFWCHRHRFEPTTDEQTKMIDEIEYQLPFGLFGLLFGGAFTRVKLQRMFDYRHQVVIDHFRSAGEKI